MKRKFLSVLLVLTLCFCVVAVSACNKNNDDPPSDEGDNIESGITQIELNYDNYVLDLSENETLQLTAQITPSDAAIQTLIWESSDTSVVTVSGTGLVSPVGEGEAEITVYSSDRKVSAVCIVTVE